MAYPTLPARLAEKYLDDLQLNPDATIDQYIVFRESSDSFGDPHAQSLQAKVQELRSTYPDDVHAKAKPASDFEAAASAIVHSEIGEKQYCADPEFWIWLSVTHFLELIFRRDQKIVAAWESGQKYSEIARAFDLSKGNVKDRIERFYRAKRNHESTNPFDKISQRTQNIFQKVGISTVEQVVDRYNRNELLCIDNFGRKGLREIEMWFPVGSLKRTST